MSVIFVPMPGDTPFAGRTLRKVSAPSLSVIVASTGDRVRLEHALRALVGPAAAASAEVLVARADTPSHLSDLARTFTGVRFVMANPGANRSELLSLGMSESSGHVIALTDDERATDEDWNEILAHRGGVIRPGPGLTRQGTEMNWLEHLKQQGVTMPNKGN